MSLQSASPFGESAGIEPSTGREPLRSPEDELVEQRGLIEALLQSSYDGLCVVSGDGRFVEINRGFERITGQKRSDWIGKTTKEMQALPGFGANSTVQLVLDGRDASSTIITLRGQTILVTANAHRDPRGAILHIIVNVRNMSHLNDLRHQLESSGQTSANPNGADDAFQREYLRSLLVAAGLKDVVVASRSMVTVLSAALQIAQFEVGSLISGETGTGKGMLASFIHKMSSRAQKPFIHVNCAAIPDSLVESELFGYAAGAFTGSLSSGKAGEFERADGGTLFLDEIGDLPLPAQAKLLTFLDDRIVRRVGGTSSKRLDVRLLAATNRNLRDLVQAGTFRRDLFYRLDVLPLYIPPLRERREDVEALITLYLEGFGKEFRVEHRIAPDSLSLLLGYPYPGNVRELRNIVAQVALRAQGREIQVADLPDCVRAIEPVAKSRGGLPEGCDLALEDLELTGLKQQLEAVERRILAKYAATYHSTYEIAKRTGIHQTSVARKLRRYGISVS